MVRVLNGTLSDVTRLFVLVLGVRYAQKMSREGSE